MKPERTILLGLLLLVCTLDPGENRGQHGVVVCEEEVGGGAEGRQEPKGVRRRRSSGEGGNPQN